MLVTDRGAVVAELVPPGQSTAGSGAPPALLTLAKDGRLSLEAENDPAAYPKLSGVLKRRSSIDLLEEERGAR